MSCLIVCYYKPCRVLCLDLITVGEGLPSTDLGSELQTAHTHTHTHMTVKEEVKVHVMDHSHIMGKPFTLTYDIISLPHDSMTSTMLPRLSE